MKVVIIGYFTEASKKIISNEFPQDWNVAIVTPEESDLSLKNADVVIPEHIKIDAEFLSKAKKIKFVQTGAGFDNVDIEACTRKGIWVANAAGVNAIAVAEHVMALILYTAGMPDGFKFHKKRYAFFIENIKKVIAGEEPDSALNKIY